MKFFSRNFFIFSLVLCGIVSGSIFIIPHALAQNAEEPCTVTNATFNPYTPSGEYLENFYREINPPEVALTITTSSCQNKQVHVALWQADIDGNLEEPIQNLKKDQTLLPGTFTIPENNSLTIRLVSGEKTCTGSVLGFGIVDIADCKYYIVAKPTGATLTAESYNSRNQLYGNLDYECDILCNDFWRYVSDTSVKPVTEVPLEDNGGFGGVSAACANIAEGCYELSAGFADALGIKMAAIDTTSDGSLGGIINLIIAFATGIAGVIVVGRIFYLGFVYMSNQKNGNPVQMEDVKSKIFKALIGFVLLLSIYTLLKTINPDLLELTPRISAVTLLDVPERTSDPLFNEVIESVDATSVTGDITDFTDPTFLTYLYHQQGEGGAPSILWAANRGLTTIPIETPFIKNKGKTNASQINDNMRSNVNKDDMQKVIGTSEVTPLNFLKYWRKKIEAFKNSTQPIPNGIVQTLLQVSQETGIDNKILTVMCRIESKCTTEGITIVNKFGYAGLFQLSNKEQLNKTKNPPVYRKTNGVWEDYKKSNGILLNAYHNSYVGAKYALHNLSVFKNQQAKINQ